MPLFALRRHRILWFSRGNGRGHATIDLAILEQLRRLRADCAVQFVSYDAGARTFAEQRQPVIDLNLPARPPLWELLVRAGAVLQRLRPHLIVCHEEFAPLALAASHGLPALFITHWFLRPEDLLMQTLAYAREVIFVDEPGIFEEPPCVRGRVSYVGPVLRDFRYTRADRPRARAELGLPAEALVISVLPGSWTEAMVPTFDLILSAYTALDAPEKRLIWVAGQDHAWIGERVAERGDVIVKEFDWEIDRLMVASDVAITKANYTTVKELARLGIPSVSLSHGTNPIDAIYAARVETNVPLDPREITADPLAGALELLRESFPAHLAAPLPLPRRAGEGATGAAERLAYQIDQLRNGARPLFSISPHPGIGRQGAAYANDVRHFGATESTERVATANGARRWRTKLAAHSTHERR